MPPECVGGSIGHVNAEYERAKGVDERVEKGGVAFASDR